MQSEEKSQIWRSEALQWIRSQSEDLEAILLRYNSFDMLANLMITQLMSDPETYKETTHRGMAAVVEYAALLYLKHPFSEGEEFVIDGPILEKIEKKISGIFTTLALYYATEELLDASEQERTALGMFRYHTITNELVVRSPGTRITSSSG